MIASMWLCMVEVVTCNSKLPIDFESRIFGSCASTLQRLDSLSIGMVHVMAPFLSTLQHIMPFAVLFSGVKLLL